MDLIYVTGVLTSKFGPLSIEALYSLEREISPFLLNSEGSESHSKLMRLIRYGVRHAIYGINNRWAPRRLLARLRPVLFNFMFMASLIFITGLPKVKDWGLIMVVVDRFSKYASFSPAPHACTAEVAADLFFNNVVKYWKIPADVVSDRDAQFTGKKVLYNCTNEP